MLQELAEEQMTGEGEGQNCLLSAALAWSLDAVNRTVASLYLSCCLLLCTVSTAACVASYLRLQLLSTFFTTVIFTVPLTSVGWLCHHVTRPELHCAAVAVWQIQALTKLS